MTYIYDIILNFTSEERLIEFFEWETTDILDHIKKIPIIRVPSKTLHDLLTKDVIVSSTLLNKIKNHTTMYKKTKDLVYALLITDLNKVIALEFNSKGNIISRSGLLLDEEEEVIEESSDELEEEINYKVIKDYQKESFLTREEIKKKRYLLKEIENIYKDNNIDKLKYLYEELYKDDDRAIVDKYLRIKNDLENNYSKIHNALYEIVRLSYIKK